MQSTRLRGTADEIYYSVHCYATGNTLEHGSLASLRDIVEVLADFPAVKLISSRVSGGEREYYDELKAIGRERGIEVVFVNG